MSISTMLHSFSAQQICEKKLIWKLLQLLYVYIQQHSIKNCLNSLIELFFYFILQ